MSSLRHKSEFAKAPLDPHSTPLPRFACERKPAGGPATSQQTCSPGSGLLNHHHHHYAFQFPFLLPSLLIFSARFY